MRDQPGKVLAREVMSEYTRKTKNILVFISLASFIIVVGGLIPNSISAFGISLTVANQKHIVLAMLISIVYLLVQLAYRVFIDFLSFKADYYNSINLKFSEEDRITPREVKGNFFVPGIKEKEMDIFYKMQKANLRIQTIVELIIPILIGLFSFIYILVKMQAVQ